MSDERVATGLRRQLEARRALLDGGARHIGWKTAFGAPAMLERMALEGPVVGYLTDHTLFERGASADTSDWTAAVVEFELALHLGTAIPAGSKPRDARTAVSAVGAAIELADIDLPLAADQLSDIVAGNIFHKGVILGHADEGRGGLDIAGLDATITHGSESTQVSDLEAFTGEYGWVLTAAADTLAEAGEGLSAGDIVIAGSVIPPIRVTDPMSLTYRLGDQDRLHVTCR